MHRFIVVGVTGFALAALFLGTYFVLNSDTLDTKSIPQPVTALETKRLIANGHPIDAWVADTPVQRRDGLSIVDSLKQNQGMLFIFDSPGTYGFWMKDMRFAIDILWIDEHKRVVHLVSGVAPDTFPQSFEPDMPARYVLELAAGAARAKGIEVGTSIIFD